ncbi:rRNA pseudouridine synthase [bacterium]|nr:rRNA pseudouridine synthase [bacterium]
MDAPAAKIESRPRRLQVILAEAGLTSRRKAEAWIAAGRVSVDGEIVRRQGLCLDAAGHDIRVDGRPLPSPPPVGVWKLHKPVGVTCTLEDRHARRTLRDLWGSEGDRLGLRPVGRLDRDSRGLLLLSNDGELTHRLTHPRYAVRRVYEATLAGPLHAGLLPILTAGVEIDGRRARPEAVEVLRHEPATTVVRIVIC